MTTIRILIENADGLVSATASDEVGTVATAVAKTLEQAVSKVRRRAEQRLGPVEVVSTDDIR